MVVNPRKYSLFGVTVFLAVTIARSKINSDFSNNYIILHSGLYVTLTGMWYLLLPSLPAGKRPYYPRNKRIPTVRLRYEVGLQIEMKSADKLYLHTSVAKFIFSYGVGCRKKGFMLGVQDAGIIRTLIF